VVEGDASVEVEGENAIQALQSSRIGNAICKGMKIRELKGRNNACTSPRPRKDTRK
jgi:hypothetical protein